MHDAAVREDRGRGQITRAFSGEEGDNVRNLLWAGHTPKRYGRIELRELGRICHGAEIDRRRHCPRTDPDN